MLSNLNTRQKELGKQSCPFVLCLKWSAHQLRFVLQDWEIPITIAVEFNAAAEQLQITCLQSQPWHISANHSFLTVEEGHILTASLPSSQTATASEQTLFHHRQERCALPPSSHQRESSSADHPPCITHRLYYISAARHIDKRPPKLCQKIVTWYWWRNLISGINTPMRGGCINTGLLRDPTETLPFCSYELETFIQQDKVAYCNALRHRKCVFTNPPLNPAGTQFQNK